VEAIKDRAHCSRQKIFGLTKFLVERKKTKKLKTCCVLSAAAGRERERKKKKEKKVVRRPQKIVVRTKLSMVHGSWNGETAPVKSKILSSKQFQVILFIIYCIKFQFAE
jgi:hypothetical protein